LIGNKKYLGTTLIVQGFAGSKTATATENHELTNLEILKQPIEK
jgi:hypothetical protein